MVRHPSTLSERFAALEFSDILDLSYLGLDSVPSPPDGIESLNRVRLLCLDGNRISDLPTWISSMEGLYLISMRSNGLTEVPAIPSLQNSGVVLDLAGNRVSSPHFDSLGGIEVLNMSHNSIERLPGGLVVPDGLVSLNLRGNLLRSITAGHGIERLHELDLADNKLGNIEFVVTAGSQLQYLDIANNEVTALPSDVGELTNLTGLNISHNKLDELPAALGELAALERLELSNNKIKHLGSNAAQLVALGMLVASQNGIDDPESFLQPPNVSTLGLRGNQIKSLPANLEPERYFFALDLRDNELVEVPPVLSAHQVVNLYLSGNSLPL